MIKGHAMYIIITGWLVSGRNSLITTEADIHKKMVVGSCKVYLESESTSECSDVIVMM